MVTASAAGRCQYCTLYKEKQRFRWIHRTMALILVRSFEPPRSSLPANPGLQRQKNMRRFVALALSSTLVLQVAPLMAAPAAPGARAGRAQAPVATGALNGTAHSASGQTLSNYTVQLRNLQTGQVAGTSTSNAVALGSIQAVASCLPVMSGLHSGEPRHGQTARF